jgi:hypothetical protein
MNRKLFALALPVVGALVLSACTTVIDPQLAAASNTEKMQVPLQFMSHVQMGMAEADVYVETEDGSVHRITADEVEQFADAPVFGTAVTVHHDPFGLDPASMQPFEQGIDLGFTLGEWLAAAGTGTYTVSGEQTVLDLSLEKLVPNGVYTLWCSMVSVPPAFHVVDIACGNPYGTDNMFVADDTGSAQVRLNTTTMPDAAEDYLSVIALAYHSDGQTYGEYPGDFGLNSHVQIMALVPPPDDPAWQVLE